MTAGVAAALGAAVMFGLAGALQAQAAQQEATTPGLDARLLLRLLRYPTFVAAIVLNLTGFAGHLLALRSAPLFLVQALVASSVAVTAVLVSWWWHIGLGRAGVAAVVALCAGLALVTSAARESGTPTTTAAQRSWLLVAVAALALAGWAAGRRHGPWGAALLGLLAGCGYALVALSGRVLPTLIPADLVAEPATYALAGAGVLAFLLYSTGLQRGAVLTSTSAMIVTQTSVPAVAGVLLLGDGVRQGGAWAAVAGFAVAVAGTLTLTRRDPAVLEEIASRDAGRSTEPN